MAVITQSTAVVNFEVYEGGSDRLIGLATVELPNVEFETSDTKRNGIMGTIAMPIGPNLGSQELKLTWRNVEKESAALIGFKSVDLSLYGAVNNIDAATGEITVVQHRIETRVVPKTLELGKFEPSATMDTANTFEIITLLYAIDNDTVIDYDKLNYKFESNGVDYGASVRTALGI